MAMELDLDFSEMLIFVLTTVCLHGITVILCSIFYETIGNYNLFQKSRIQQSNVSKNYTKLDIVIIIIDVCLFK